MEQTVLMEFHGTDLDVSLSLYERIPVALWFPFCGGQSCSVKKGVGCTQSVTVCGQTPGRASSCMDFYSRCPTRLHHGLPQHSLLRAHTPVLHASVLITSAAA